MTIGERVERRQLGPSWSSVLGPVTVAVIRGVGMVAGRLFLVEVGLGLCGCARTPVKSTDSQPPDVTVSLVGTFIVMGLLGFTLNNLTLFGLVLAIGIVEDDAIVLLENIERWLEKGLRCARAVTRDEPTRRSGSFFRGRPMRLFRAPGLRIWVILALIAIVAVLLALVRPTPHANLLNNRLRHAGDSTVAPQAIPEWDR